MAVQKSLETYWKLYVCLIQLEMIHNNTWDHLSVFKWMSDVE